VPRGLIIGVALVACLGSAGVAALLLLTEREPAPPKRVAVTTAPVTSGRVITETKAVGTLSYPSRGPVAAGAAGVVTWLPKTGSIVRRGDVLYTVDARPAVLLRGELPAYRSFERGMSDGQDVLQLETGLAALGYFRGDIDRHFSPWTTAAVKAWQRALGIRPTGRLDRSAVLFSRQSLRVARRTARVGAVVALGAELYATSATRRVVRVDVALEDQGLARAGRQVTVELPAGRDTRGRVTSVGAPRQRRSDSGTTVVVPVVVSLRVPRAAEAFAQAAVTVRFRSPSRKDVLTVPVSALIALGPDRFGVEVPAGTTTRRVAVRVGAFVGGRVEIAGRGLAAGVRVVVPSS
jgi:peptidoglycan hydrolase-like protein with peptidoglycan-binding domain